MRNSDTFVLILHIFLMEKYETMEKYENDKNDFLQRQRIRQLDTHCICVAIFIILESQSEKLWHQNYKLRPQNYKLRLQN